MHNFVLHLSIEIIFTWDTPALTQARLWRLRDYTPGQIAEIPQLAV